MSVVPVQTSVGLKPADFASGSEVRWCPGCGDYSILATVKKTLAKMGADRSRTVFVSGIGCSSRFPYYMGTYGFHSIHGRAPAVATGLKLARPDLDVWIITGDGDALSIGGNHFIHLLRRNLNVKIILFNNRIYGLTKGQYSPTSEQNKKTKSSPMGAPERPIRPASVALGAEASFVARTVDVDLRHMEYVFERAAKHVGSAFIEVYQNCVIFNDGAYTYASDKEVKADNTLYLEHGKPLIFGKERNKGIRLKGMTPEVVSLTDGQSDGLLVHDEKAADPTLAFMLSRMRYPEMPEAMGIFRAVDMPCYSDLVRQQMETAVAQKGRGDLQTLLRGPESWVVR
ncbi:MAG TPA: 2-oxoacid:ferredoxin oxidoreductase subunit beta [Tepidisphaeraceae bacterium]|nr:2-oxoacid:ferredoxin oxidoreductase subunit beta [Tepidisphaeraceae bacterium]